MTVISHVAVLPPPSVVTVIIAVPAPTAVTTPSSTVATFSSLDFHVTFLLVAFSGDIVAVRVTVPPISSVSDVRSSVTLSTGTSVAPASDTVTVHVAVYSPSAVVTVIVAVPALMAVTTPSTTVATSGLSEVQFTALFVALPGDTIAVRVNVSSTVSFAEFVLRLTPVTATVADVTVTEQVACTFVPETFTVIVV